MKRAFITGIAGQDGSYLAEHLLAAGYEVYGIVRRNSVPEHQESRLHHIESQLHLMYGDVTDFHSVCAALAVAKPDEVYNLAAQSHVRISSDVPIFTANTNAVGVLNVLESCRLVCPHTRFYQASSSEMFGNSLDDDGFQRESTPMRPVSPYGCAKVYAYHIVRHYRNAHKMFAANGILFNHESPRRGSNFVTSKIVRGAVAIKQGRQNVLELGNMESFRDWGHSKDYTRAMMMILAHDVPDDFVVASTTISYNFGGIWWRR
jgi:GDPmannose 4,6-dehydratase